MAIKLTGNPYIDEFKTFYEYNQHLKYMSDLYYICTDGITVYVHSPISHLNKMVMLKTPLSVYRETLVLPSASFQFMKDLRKTKMDGERVHVLDEGSGEYLHDAIRLYTLKENRETYFDLPIRSIKSVEELNSDDDPFYKRFDLFEKYWDDHFQLLDSNLTEDIIDGKVIHINLIDPSDNSKLFIELHKSILQNIKKDETIGFRILPDRDVNMPEKRWILYRVESELCSTFTLTAYLSKA